MPYVKVKELLAMGKKNHACVLAFDAADVNMIKYVIKGAETAGRPVIVMLYPGMRNIMPFGVFAEVTRYYAERASVPVGLHLDHCSDFDMILEAIHEGFPSVMADGSVLPFEKNAAFTKKVVEVARNFDGDVEGELGHVERQPIPMNSAGRSFLPDRTRSGSLWRRRESPLLPCLSAARMGYIRAHQNWILNI